MEVIAKRYNATVDEVQAVHDLLRRLPKGMMASTAAVDELRDGAWHLAMLQLEIAGVLP